MPSIHNMKAINIQAWIDEHREILKPPVGNKLIWDDGELMAFIVAGPNERTDYHDDPVDEFFYQIEGNMILRVIEEAGQPPLDIEIKEGEIFSTKIELCPNGPCSMSFGSLITIRVCRSISVRQRFLKSQIWFLVLPDLVSGIWFMSQT